MFCRSARRALNVSPRIVSLPRSAYVPCVLAAWCLERLPSPEGRFNPLTVEIVKDTFRYKYYDSTKARTRLGWKPERTLEDAVRDAVAFYREEGLI